MEMKVDYGDFRELDADFRRIAFKKTEAEDL